jgi:hypothetical protein
MVLARVAAALACGIFALLAPLAARAQLVTSISGLSGSYVTVNPATHRAYVASASDLVVLEGTARIATIPLPMQASYLTVNSATHRLYAVHADSSLSVIDTLSHTVRGLGTGVFGRVVLSESTGRAYANVRSAREIAVFDASDNRSTIALPFGACGMALNDRTRQLYVSHCVTNAVSASVVELDTGAITTLPFPGVTSASTVAVDTAANRAYVGSEDGIAALLVIDGATRTAHVINNVSVPSFRSAQLAVNSSNHRIYATWASQIAVIDGTTETVIATASQGEIAFNFRADDVTGKLFALAYNSLLGVDAAGALTTIALPYRGSSMDLDPALQRVYVVTAAGSVLIDLNGPASPPRGNYQGMWWNAPAGSESGWGVDIAQQGDILFAAWFTYDETGDPVWFVMPRGERTSGETFSGPLYTTTGPDFSAATFDPTRVTTRVVGTMTFQFTANGTGTMDVLVNGVRIIKPITRQVFASPVPTCTTGTIPGIQNFTDLFWNPSESGWGAFLTHQGDNVFTVWFTYVNGKATWFVASNVVRVSSESGGRMNTFSGTLYRTTGPGYAGAFNPSAVAPAPIGAITLRFVDDAAQFNWSIGSRSGQKSIVREVFSYPRTFCY